MEDINEKLFGKLPKKGYRFTVVEVSLIDNDIFKGFDISWVASGIGFGHLTMAWGIDIEHLKNYPHQQGFYSSTECMSDDFVQALMKKAAPKFAELIIKNDLDRKR